MARTVEVDVAADVGLLEQLPAPGALAWVSGGDGLVGWGEAARLEVAGPDRFTIARAWWAATAASFAVQDEVGLPGSGPVAFGSFAFDSRPGHSVLVVPRVVVGRREGRTWLTTVGRAPALSSPQPVRPPVGIRYAEGSRSVTDWPGAVAQAVRRIDNGDLDKVVLARDLVASADADIDSRWLLCQLAERYESCFIFAVDGLVGATPELLVRRTGGRVDSRVLAGTVRRRGDEAADALLAQGLLASVKDLEEHAFAVRSVTEVLARHCATLTVPADAHVLSLANVQHLATDITGRLADDTSALALAGQLHPTAAVCGTPTEAARTAIRELEGMDRARYAGPVGWVDARGDGEWGIALRCAEVSGRDARLFAGCGIVAGSDPDAELAESQAKLVPIRDALGS
jgi:menaquinone-specific isochorismate synthase